MASQSRHTAGVEPGPRRPGSGRSWPRSLFWVAVGTTILAGFVAISILAPEDSDDRAPTWLLALVGWLGIAAGAFFIVKGVLIVMRKLDRRRSLILAGASFAAMVVAIILHNVISALFDVEEGMFFIFALFVAPVLIVAALVRAAFPGKGA